MVSDQELANSVEIFLRQISPNSTITINGVVQQLEAQLGLNLSHKAGFIKDHIDLLLRPIHPTNLPPHPQPPQQQHPKDHFALQHHHPFHHQQQAQVHHHQHHQNPHSQFQNTTTTTHPQIRPHFVLPHQQHRHEELEFQYPPVHLQQQPSHLLHQQLPLQSQRKPHRKQQKVVPDNFVQNVAGAPGLETPREGAPTGTKRRGGPGGLNKVCGVSPELQVIVGKPTMPRTEIVKQLWAYIRKNNLQDPSNKRKIICNDALRVVFETDCTDMFKMNKLLAKHIISLEPSKESSKASKKLRVEMNAETESTEAGPPLGVIPEVKAETESMEDGPPLVLISEALARFFGTGGREMSQLEAIRRVWEYINVNHLVKDPLDEVIMCDPKLQELFGCESIPTSGLHEMLVPHFFRQSQPQINSVHDIVSSDNILDA